MQRASRLQYRCETIDIQIFHGRHGHVIILRWCRCERQKKIPCFFMENGGENKLEFIFSTIFPKTGQKLFFFLHGFSKKTQKNCFHFFSPPFFQKQQNYFLKYFVDYLCANWLSFSLYHFQGSTHYLNLMACGDQYVYLSLSPALL